LISLVEPGERLPTPTFCIPTPTEDDRTRVLAILDEVGLKRDEDNLAL
jgi:hypothetical protein